MIDQIFDNIINEMNSLICDYSQRNPNLVNMHSYKKFVVTVVVLVFNVLASTHLIT